LIVTQVLEVVPRVDKLVVLLLNMRGRVVHRSPKISSVRLSTVY